MGFAYNPDCGWTSQHQMSANGKFDGITRDDLFELANNIIIKESKEIIDHVSTVTSGCGKIARDCGVSDKMIKAIEPQFQFMH